MDEILDLVRRTWGFHALRPLQREAIEASLAGRDALIVLPTGGGKSLCYQVPALMAPGLMVVVSPLISLMKDQVDRLAARGIPSAFINSTLDPAQRSRVEAAVERGEIRLLYLAPERFGDAAARDLLSFARVRAFAIDEAHCISHWGHDFREAYGRLSTVRGAFPGAPVHALTATATWRVRDDIVRQLALRDPLVLVGDFFRPNLRLRMFPRREALSDILGVIRRRRGRPGLVYAIRRADVDDLAQGLQDAGIPAVAYHAGLEESARARAQEDWTAGRAEVIVATVAFGMGIDRRDVRFVVHAAMPQSLEHYQQETGWAGRDGREAECVMFWSPGDVDLWRGMIEATGSPETPAKVRLVEDMLRFRTSAVCRHRALVEYFGQEWRDGPCRACDVCLGVSRPGLGPIDPALYRLLRRVRREIADSLGMPACGIVGDSTLLEMAAARPQKLEDLGHFDLRRWASAFLAAMRAGPERYEK